MSIQKRQSWPLSTRPADHLVVRIPVVDQGLPNQGQPADCAYVCSCVPTTLAEALTWTDVKHGQVRQHM
jgi:hypothetical protein